jgi:hypothetical protein
LPLPAARAADVFKSDQPHLRRDGEDDQAAQVTSDYHRCVRAQGPMLELKE